MKPGADLQTHERPESGAVGIGVPGDTPPPRRDRVREEHSYRARRRIIMVSMILVTVIPFVLILAIGYSYFTRSLESGAISMIQRIVEDHREMIEIFLEERRTDLEYIADAYAFAELSRTETLSIVFAGLQRHANAFVDMGVFNSAGLHVAYVGPYRLIGKDYGRTDWFKEVIKRGYYISDIFLGYRKVPHFIIAVARGRGHRRWVIRATVDSFLFNTLVEKVRIGETGEAYLLNSEGVLQTARRSGGDLLDTPADIIRYPPDRDAIATFIEKDEQGKDYLYAATWLHDKKWLLVARQEKADAFEALRFAVTLILIVSVIGGATIIGVAVYLTDRIVRRLEILDGEKEDLSRQLIRASRLAELGEMAAGIAHEINNPLQIIQNEQALMKILLSDVKTVNNNRTSAKAAAEIEESLTQIRIQTRRCAAITQAILNFGRQCRPKFQDIHLARFIPEISGMVKQKAEVHGIVLAVVIPPETPEIFGDVSQLQQVFLNLLNNGIDAIIAQKGAGGGNLTVRLASCGPHFVEVRVEDDGCGIPADKIDRVFTPFFTTKPVGQGTGLGLSVCYGIIHKMGGKIKVQSQEGIGTVFTLHLPLSHPSLSDVASASAENQAPCGTASNQPQSAVTHPGGPD
jgi:two-component system NtrC family sensor kinase